MDIEEDLKEVSERFNNGTETIEDILNFCRNYEITFENGIKMRLVEKKYLDKLINEYKNVLAEREEDKKKINKLEYCVEELKKYNKTISDRVVEYKKNRIPKQKVKDILLKYKYVSINDTEGIVQFYQEFKKLVEE